jgi:hypothetical protein
MFILIFQALWTAQVFGYVAGSDSAKRPIVAAVRVMGSITIDGDLSEPEWGGPSVSNFTQYDPVEGAPANQKTEVWVAYDDAAIYVAARLWDASPDSVTSRVARRDASVTSDWFEFDVDTYHDRRTGFYFEVNPSGSVIDGTLYNDEWNDNTWDGVWTTATKIDSHGWTLEMRIPYSQLRFPKLDEYVWGVNFSRVEARTQEVSYFVMVPKKESGRVSRFADLVGIHGINPPRKLEVLPYIASTGKYLAHDPGDPFNDGSLYRQSIGANIKYGIGSNLTLNATFNPDFGQVEVDPEVVNLTQYETFFDEKRPFFIEGSNFFDFGYGGANNNWGFNWGSPSFFYSRRIGRPPSGDLQHSGFSDIPDKTTIIGAGKLTGKIGDDFSLGALQAVTAREYAHIDSSGVRFADIVEPLSYYGIFRGIREFNKGSQGLGFIATSTLRDLNTPYLTEEYNRNAFSFAVDGWTNLDADKVWVLTGWLTGTTVTGSTTRITNLQTAPLHYYQRPDASYLHLDSSATSLSGYGGRFALNKQSGNFYLNAAFGFLSPGIETNDLGFLFRTDVINSHIVLGYNWFQPDGVFRYKNFRVATFKNFDFGGDRTGDGYYMFYNAQLMNYWSFSGNFNVSPAVTDTRNTRGGPKMKNTNGYSYYIYGGTDSRNPLVYGMEIDEGRSESGGSIISLYPSVEWKPTAGLDLKVGPAITHDITIAQYVTTIQDNLAAKTFGSRYIFGELDQKEISANIRLDWTLTPSFGLTLFLQPLISVGKYTQFKELRQPGTYDFNWYERAGKVTSTSDSVFVHPDLSSTPNDSISFSSPDFNIKSLIGNAVLRWEFLPGSTLYFVWTHQQQNYDDPGDPAFAHNFSTLLNTRGDNVFIIKMSYWWNP